LTGIKQHDAERTPQAAVGSVHWSCKSLPTHTRQFGRAAERYVWSRNMPVEMNGAAIHQLHCRRHCYAVW